MGLPIYRIHLNSPFQIYILVGFVLISSGVILQIYSSILTLARLGDVTIAPPLIDIINAMLAGIVIEIIFLVSVHSPFVTVHTKWVIQ